MNSRGISAMHDAILFVTLISLSGAILLPAFISNPISESQKERERSETADESLIVLLSITPKEFNYTLAPDPIKDMMGKAGIDVEKGLGKSIFEWLLGIKQYHKNYGELIAEDLASQFLLSLGNKNPKLNILTYDFDKNLRKNISKELDKILEGRYKFNLTAKWNPIIGLPFGGEICVGAPPPQAAYVSKTFVTMPFSPVIHINYMEIHLNKNWIKEKIKNAGVIGKIYDLLDKIPSSDEEWEKFEKELKKNLTELLQEFLFTGIMDSDGNIILPGILNISLHLILEKIINYICKNEDFSSFVSSLNNMFGEAKDVVKNVMKYIINLTLDEIYKRLNEKPIDGSIKTKIKGLGNILIKHVIEYIKNSDFGNALKEYISDFVDLIVKEVKKGGEAIKEIKNTIDDWILNRISISRAEVSLAIWEE